MRSCWQRGIRPGNVPCDTEKIRSPDPTLPRYGTDLATQRSVMRNLASFGEFIRFCLVQVAIC